MARDQVLLEAGYLIEFPYSLHILCDLGVWPDLSVLWFPCLKREPL